MVRKGVKIKNICPQHEFKGSQAWIRSLKVLREGCETQIQLDSILSNLLKPGIRLRPVNPSLGGRGRRRSSRPSLIHGKSALQETLHHSQLVT